MNSSTRKIYSDGLNKGFVWKFPEHYQIKQLSEEGQKIPWLKHEDSNNQDEDSNFDKLVYNNYYLICSNSTI